MIYYKWIYNYIVNPYVAKQEEAHIPGGAGLPMKKFSVSLFGYCKKQVNAYLLSLRKDYEKELSKSKDRLWEVNAENRELKAKLLEYQEKLSRYGEQELYISKALVKAEESAQEILKESYKKMEIERVKINQEKEKWKTREKEIIEQLLDFQNKAYDLMESFQSEINYLTSRN